MTRDHGLLMLSTLHFFQTCKRVEKKKEKQARDLRCGEGTSSERERERRRKNKEDSKKEGGRKTLFYSFIIIQTRRTLTTRQRSCRTLGPRSFLLLLLRPNTQNSLPSVSFIIRLLTYLRIQRSRKKKKRRFSGSYLRLFFLSFYYLLSSHCG